MVKYYLELDEESQRRAEEAMEDLGLRSMEQFFSKSLTIVGWILQRKKEGHKVGFMDSDGNFREMDIFWR